MCFRCDERYSTKHRCKVRDQRELKILVVHANDEEMEVFEDEDKIMELMELQQVKVELVVELSLNSVVGLTNLGVIKLKGMIKSETIVVLIICGATHNFIA